MTITDGVVVGTYEERWVLQSYGSWSTHLDYATNAFTESGKCTA